MYWGGSMLREVGVGVDERECEGELKGVELVAF